MIEAYPLSWPPGRPRTKWRDSARFQTTLDKAVKNVQREVRQLGGTDMVISTSHPPRADGKLMRRPGFVTDVGVAVYFTYKKRPMCFACDRWNEVRANMQAIAKTIEALRGIERWGSGQMVEQAFTGFIALPAPEQWWQVLGLTADATPEQIDQAYRRLAMEHHPDRGGDSGEMARINAARDDGLARTT